MNYTLKYIFTHSSSIYQWILNNHFELNNNFEMLKEYTQTKSNFNMYHFRRKIHYLVVAK